MWYAYGLASFRPPSNLVAGSLDFNGTVDVSSIAALKDQYPTAGFLMSASAPCLPSLTSCNASGFHVDANAYISGYVCGVWWVPYNNSLGFTHTAALNSGNGAFSYVTGCSSTGGSRTLGMLQGRMVMMYYYSSSQLMVSPNSIYPPVKNVALSTTTFFNPYVPAQTGDQGAGMGYRQWVFTTVTGGCQACAQNGNGGQIYPHDLHQQKERCAEDRDLNGLHRQLPRGGAQFALLLDVIGAAPVRPIAEPEQKRARNPAAQQ